MDPEIQAFYFMGIVAIIGLVLFLIPPFLLLWLAVRWRKGRSIEGRTEKEKKEYFQNEQKIIPFLSFALFGWLLVLYPLLLGWWRGEPDALDYLMLSSHLVFGFLLVRSIIFRLRTRK